MSALSLSQPFHDISARWRLRRWRGLLARIKDCELPLAELPLPALAEQSLALRYRARCGEPLAKILPEAYALVREASRRTIGLAHYDVQLLGGVALQEGTIAEMQTGEGKTLTATLPLYLHALAGKGAHLATANDYLAERDANWMNPVYQALQLSVSSVTAATSDAGRRSAYASDITYGTAREFGFDFLRDRLRRRAAAEAHGLFFAPLDRTPTAFAKDTVQREPRFALVDEADSLLIDEARVPLIISAIPAGDASPEIAGFRWSAEVASQFSENDQFLYDPVHRRVELTAAGRQLVRTLQKPPLLDSFSIVRLYESVERAIKVQRDYLRDRHYVVRDGAIVIVDEFTGRLAEGRKWRDGIHPAVEAREGLAITPDAGSAAQVTVQEYFSRYPKLAGMTGTVAAAAREFRKVYNLRGVSIPTHRPVQREEWPTRILATAAERWLAIVDEVRMLRERGRPVLIGTRSIDKSEQLSKCLREAGIPHRVLHARHVAAEADIVAQAGQSGVVTVATNMAGRGTDIRLAESVAKNGGLHVVCSEFHDASRIDRQLIGRCARQGDPGSFRQFASLEDDLLDKGLGPDRAAALRQSGRNSNQPLDRLDPIFRKAQRRIERRHFRDRHLLMHYARERKRLHEQLGQDPYLDAGIDQ